MKQYNIVKENQKIRTLLSIIKSNYNSDNKNSLQEVNLSHVMNRIPNKDIKIVVKSAWQDLEMIVGQEIRLLENNCKKSFINRIYKKSKDMSFIIKRKTNQSSNNLFDSIPKDSNIQVESKEINI